MGELFGTDGIRGTANADLSCELALQVGRAVAIACRDGVLDDQRRPTVVVGRDTRLSGPMLEAALVAGLSSAGADVVLAGVLPTPGVAYLTAESCASAGVVLSASHNPVADNGVKVFGGTGHKLDTSTEDALEALVGSAGDLPTGARIGSVRHDGDARARYVDHLVASVGAGLTGMRVVVDCAHGAACTVAPEVLRRLDVDVTVLNGEPDGSRINVDCGATHPSVVAKAAAEAGAIGLTHDGDADRVMGADETGRVVDGDQVIAMLARRLRDEDRLPNGAVVVTVMTNQAFRIWAQRERLSVDEVAVGDRNVVSEMRARGINLGGEQSGHVIIGDRTSTGDGVLTGLALLEAVAAGGGRLADLVPFEPFPQVLVNVRTPNGRRLDDATPVWDAVRRAQADLGDTGRVLVRPSGTEPLVRVMVEAPSDEEADEVAQRLAAVVAGELG